MPKSKDRDYIALAKKKMHRPAEKKSKRRILVYGRNKKGKSTLSATAPNILIADPEEGTDEMKIKNPHVWDVQEWEDMQGFYGFLRSGAPCPNCPEEHEFEWFSVDGMTKLHKLALNFVMKVEEERNLDRQPGFVQQRDYGKANSLLGQMLVNLHALPLDGIYTAQERMIVEGEFADEDEDVENPAAQFVPDLPKGIRAEMNAIVGIIGRLYVVKLEDGRKQRRLWLGPSDQFDTGFRSDYDLPDMIKNPTIPKLVKLLNTGTTSKKTK